jgi:hypothetical protein
MGAADHAAEADSVAEREVAADVGGHQVEERLGQPVDLLAALLDRGADFGRKVVRQPRQGSLPTSVAMGLHRYRSYGL